MSMIVNRRDLDFLFYEVLNLDGVLQAQRYQDYDREAIAAILDTSQAIAEDEFLPSAGRLDANEPTFDGKRIHIIPEVKAALGAYAEAGLFAVGFDQEIGGLQLPAMVETAVMGMFFCANVGIAGYPFLTAAAARMLNACGDEMQRSVFLPAMLEGRWFGTMCLSEPQAGSSLSDIRCRAEPTDLGHYLINGSKMWISGGDHELSENIIHMVLAKIPGGPSGVKGISLFVVPKYRVEADGSIGAWNNVAVAGLNHKMGYRGTTNVLLNFGEAGECHGWLVGTPHNGLANMFRMMNEARIGVGHGATMSGLAGYLYSLQYARGRPQGRLPANKDPESPQVMIAEHADIKRLLLTQKAYVEGALALVLYCAGLVDVQKTSEDQKEIDRVTLLLELLTPVVKSWPSEYCLEANKLAIQVLGGYGYTRDYPVERFYRDNRLNPIHEGTHAIHGIDLLGRKVRLSNGAAWRMLVAELKVTVAGARTTKTLASEANALTRAIEMVGQTVDAVLSCPNPNKALANATSFLDAFGHVVIAWIWLKQALAVEQSRCEALRSDEAFYNGKMRACRFFFRYELPKVFPQLELIASLDDTCLHVPQEEFVGE